MSPQTHTGASEPRPDQTDTFPALTGSCAQLKETH